MPNIAFQTVNMYYLENQNLKVSIHPKGAELQSIFHKQLTLEYMWNGDPAFWGKYSPILFPIVGTLKEDTYYYEGKAYSLGRHGFARDMEFEARQQDGENISFLLRSSPLTLEKYPFDFELQVSYRLTADGLQTEYLVRNKSDKDMYFSVGGHPAFRVPLVRGTVYEDYYLEFARQETAPRWPITKDGLIGKEPKPLLQDTRVLPLTKDLFASDALVLKSLASSSVSLRSEKSSHGLQFDFKGFPYLGIWAAKNADFVCIEPWCGIADAADTDQQLVHKEGITKLPGGGSFKRTWSVILF